MCGEKKTPWNILRLKDTNGHILRKMMLWSSNLLFNSYQLAYSCLSLYT